MCTYDSAPKFDVHWQIIDWTALADKANGNAIKSFFKKADLQVLPKASSAESTAPWL
jgi:hypothetical protein